MLILGAVIGFLFASALAVLTLSFLGSTIVIFGILVPVLGGPLSPLIVLIFGGCSLFIATAIAYVIAAVSLLGPIATTPNSPATPNPLPAVPTELFMRGFFIGTTAAINFAAWSVSGFLIVGVALAIINLLAAIPGISRNLIYQGVLGWSSWLMPMSWLITPLGLIFFLVNLPFALIASGIVALQFDFLTCTFETSGGALVRLLGSLNGFSGGGWNLGNFTFLDGVPALIHTPFTGVGLSTHETGHTLTVAGLGGFYGYINAIDEVIVGRFTSAYGEQVPESHFPRNGLQFVRVWS